MVLDNVSGAGDRITSAIQAASRTTGTAFDYLVRTASRESAFNPTAQASTSSARGLFQFIETTWLGMVKEEGTKYGLEQQAAAIEKTPNGNYLVRDPAKRADILKLRDDPNVSALMAGAFANRNSEYLTSALGRQPTSGELYIAHFLGASGARKLIALKQSSPSASAAGEFPAAAKANRSIFYGREGQAKNAADVYASLVGKHDSAPPIQAPATQVAAILPKIPVETNSRLQTNSRVAFAPTRMAPMRITPANPPGAPVRMVEVHLPNLETPATTAAAIANDGPMFQTMFRTERDGPISNAVRQLWGRTNTNGADRPRFFPTNSPDVRPVRVGTAEDPLPKDPLA
jgi:hypothetical protein